MRNYRGGLLATACVTALAAARFDGGAAALFDEPPASGGEPPASGEPPAPGAEPPASGGEPPAPGSVADWMKSFSGEKTGEDLSNQEYLASKGFKDPDSLVASYRAAEKSIREGGKVKIPGPDASDAERAAFREAIGAPKEAAGYEVDMPAGAEGYELDTDVLDPLRAAAHKHGISAEAFKELGAVFMGKALEDAQAEVARTDTEAADKIKEWGPLANQRKEEFRRGASLLELTKADVAAIQREFGAGRTLDLFAKIGQLAGEDFFASGAPAQRFGVANLEAAEKALNGLINDGEFAAKLHGGDKGAKDRYDRAVEAVAAFKQAEHNKGRQRR